MSNYGRGRWSVFERREQAPRVVEAMRLAAKAGELRLRVEQVDRLIESPIGEGRTRPASHLMTVSAEFSAQFLTFGAEEHRSEFPSKGQQILAEGNRAEVVASFLDRVVPPYSPNRCWEHPDCCEASRRLHELGTLVVTKDASGKEVPAGRIKVVVEGLGRVDGNDYGASHDPADVAAQCLGSKHPDSRVHRIQHHTYATKLLEAVLQEILGTDVVDRASRRLVGE